MGVALKLVSQNAKDAKCQELSELTCERQFSKIKHAFDTQPQNSTLMSKISHSKRAHISGKQPKKTTRDNKA